MCRDLLNRFKLRWYLAITIILSMSCLFGCTDKIDPDDPSSFKENSALITYLNTEGFEVNIPKYKAISMFDLAHHSDFGFWFNTKNSYAPRKDIVFGPSLLFSPIPIKPGFVEAKLNDEKLVCLIKCIAIEDPIYNTSAIVESFINKYGKKGLVADSEQCTVNFSDIIFPAYFIKFKGRYVIFEFLAETSRSSADKKEHTYLYAKLTDYFLLERLAGTKAHETENDKVVDRLKKTF